MTPQEIRRRVVRAALAGRLRQMERHLDDLVGLDDEVQAIAAVEAAMFARAAEADLACRASPPRHWDPAQAVGRILARRWDGPCWESGPPAPGVVLIARAHSFLIGLGCLDLVTRHRRLAVRQ